MLGVAQVSVHIHRGLITLQARDGTPPAFVINLVYIF